MSYNAFCSLCKHIGDEYLPNTQEIPCKAFPNGIPDEIFLVLRFHNEVLPEQEGDYIFTPKEGYEGYIPQIHVPEEKIKLPPLPDLFRKLRERQKGKDKSR